MKRTTTSGLSANRTFCRLAYFSLCVSLLNCCASVLHAEDKYQHDWESLKSHPVPEWFDDAKFGIFIHWGPYSVIGYHPAGRGYAEHSPKFIYRNPKAYYDFLDNQFGGHPPEFGYKDIVPLFQAEKWNPDSWADLFERAEAKYVVLTAEHHDGYALWDSELTPWCATKVGPKRDLVGDLGEAVRKKGMKYAPSFHRERHTGFFALDKNAVESRPHPDVAEEIKRMPESAKLYGPFIIDDEFIEDYVNRWKEIQEKYRPDFMWIDAVPVFQKRWSKDYDHPQVHRFRTACMHMIADYLNNAEQWGKEVYLNNKGPHGAHNWPEGVGCREKDNLQLASIGTKWQNPATLGTSYGYMEAEEERDAYKSPVELVCLLCDVVSKNGNLLLNIGPRADGTIPEGMERRLLAIGEWLQDNGEAIFGTRPWKTFGERRGKRIKKAGMPRDTHEIEYRFTASKDEKCVYAIIFSPLTTPVRIQSLKEQEIKNASLLGSDEAIAWTVDSEGFKTELPKEDLSSMPAVLKVLLK